MLYGNLEVFIHQSTCALDLPPGQLVAVPFVDCEEGSLQCSRHKRVIFVVYHLGRTLRAGHYKAALSTPPGLQGRCSGSIQYVMATLFLKVPIRATCMRSSIAHVWLGCRRLQISFGNA